MSGAAVAPAPADGAAQPAQQQQKGFSIGSVLNLLLLYYLVSSFFRSSPAPVKDDKGVVQQAHAPLWKEGQRFDLHVYVHDEPEFPLSRYTERILAPRLLWRESGLHLDWSDMNARETTVDIQQWALQHLQSNGSLYAHVYLVKDGSDLFPHHEPSSSSSSSSSAEAEAVEPVASLSALSVSNQLIKNKNYVPQNIIHRVQQLNLYRPPIKQVKKHNLLTGENSTSQVSVEVLPPSNEHAQEEEEDKEDDAFVNHDMFEEDASSASVVPSSSSSSSSLSRVGVRGAKSRGAAWASYWRPTLHLRPIPDFTVFPFNGIPNEMKADYIITTNNAYEPLLYFDYFWLLNEHLIAINSSVDSLPLNMSISPLSLWKWRIETQMDASWKMQQDWGMQDDSGKESEMLKKMLTDTNPYLLALTFVVSMLHMLFDMLAFKNDITFWKDNKSMKGLSTRTIIMNCICQFIIFLYLLDNDTSWMILLSSGVGVAIEVWKLQKAAVIKWQPHAGFPYIRILNKNMSEDKLEEEKTQEEKDLELTAKYDAEAMRYLSYALYPMVLCYAIYSLIYESHTSWYSYILAVLVGCVYTFGFIMMCPQLYMNYKLKSVAHLPWRMLTYKALNTFIDDLFAFIITMPTMHRLSCFRDDILFFVFLYQKWIYRVDYNRVNEFGCVLISDEEQKKLQEEDANKALSKQREEEEKRRPAYIEEVSDEEVKAAAASLDAPTTDKINNNTDALPSSDVLKQLDQLDEAEEHQQLQAEKQAAELTKRKNTTRRDQ